MGYFNKKPISEILLQAEEGTHHLKRVLGPLDMVMLGIGCIIGAGLFSITGIAAAENAGPAVTLSFLFAAIGCLFAGLCYSELASMLPIAGSAYTYAYATLGELIAWIIGWDLILEYAIGAAAVSISWSAYVVALLHDFNIYPPAELIASPWQPVRYPDGTVAYGLVNLPAIAIIGAISWLLMKGVKESAFVNAIVVVIKVAVVLLFIMVGYFYINPDNYRPFIPENNGVFGEYGWSGIMRAAGVVFFAFIGFDAVSTSSQEVINPQRNIPIGILGSLFICTVLYMLFSYVMTGMVHYSELNVAAPVAVAIDKTPYWWLSWLVNVAILAGFTSVMLVLLLGQSRIFFSMAKDGMLPRWLADVHPRYGTPWHANLMLMVLVSLCGGFAPLEVVGHMTSIGTLLAFVIVCAGVLVLRRREPQLHRPFRTPLVPLVPLLGIAVCGVLIFSLGAANWLRLAAWMAIGMVVYVCYSHRNIRIPQIKP